MQVHARSKISPAHKRTDASTNSTTTKVVDIISRPDQPFSPACSAALRSLMDYVPELNGPLPVQIQGLCGPHDLRGAEHIMAVASSWFALLVVHYVWNFFFESAEQGNRRLCTMPTYHLYKPQHQRANETCQQLCTLSIQQHRDALFTSEPDECLILNINKGNVSGQNHHDTFDWLYWGPIAYTETVNLSADLQLTTCMCHVQLTAQRQILSKESMPEPASSSFYSEFPFDCSFQGVSKRLLFEGWQDLTPIAITDDSKPQLEDCKTKTPTSQFTASEDMWVVLYSLTGSEQPKS
ncbi:hypothetical protein BCR37DRAFT_193012 [Protomyces lactucae-debilis]|uniref:Uncharacterized protein n=1 Tax=Protomyces lactucae-debilis TaxID=2754530 RepID=A0A1Y2EU27_PROLT|nr:uncharacterized protein BCR37DRAFT_193012 [Protomyces lactucae-debilis]ORY75072.1 hypothetical protein BCR37DRAFT_193012 [Protomyces lactucae-debilis]